MAWLGEAVRCVLFVPPPAVPDVLQLWLRVFGSAPQNFSQNAAGMPPGASAMGPVGEYMATMGSQLGRVDLSLSPLPGNSPTPMAVMDADAAMSVLAAYVDRLITFDNLARLALNIHLTCHAADQSEAHKIFVEATGIAVPAGADNLAFQANVPLMTGTVEGGVNRLWRISTVMKQMIQVTFDAGSQTAPALVNDVVHAVDLLWDVNTVPGVITSRADGAKVFDQLLKVGRELIVAGPADLLHA